MMVVYLHVLLAHHIKQDQMNKRLNDAISSVLEECEFKMTATLDSTTRTVIPSELGDRLMSLNIAYRLYDKTRNKSRG